MLYTNYRIVYQNCMQYTIVCTPLYCSVLRKLCRLAQDIITKSIIYIFFKIDFAINIIYMCSWVLISSDFGIKSSGYQLIHIHTFISILWYITVSVNQVWNHFHKLHHLISTHSSTFNLNFLYYFLLLSYQQIIVFKLPHFWAPQAPTDPPS